MSWRLMSWQLWFGYGLGMLICIPLSLWNPPAGLVIAIIVGGLSLGWGMISSLREKGEP